MPAIESRMPSSTPAGISMSTFLLVLTFPTPPHPPQLSDGFVACPDPPQVPQVLDMAKPLWITNCCVPVPWQDWQVFFFAPGLSPEPEHVGQSTTGWISMVRLVPLHASRKGILTVVCRSSPGAKEAPARVDPGRALKADPNMVSKMSAAEAPPLPPPKVKSLKSPNPPPKEEDARAYASSLNPACWLAGPYLSNAERFFSSPRV